MATLEAKPHRSGERLQCGSWGGGGSPHGTHSMSWKPLSLVFL